MLKGILVKEQAWNGYKFLIEYVNPKGKTLRAPISQKDCFFELGKADEHAAVEFELVSGMPKKCVLPGKQAAPARPAPTADPRFTARHAICKARHLSMQLRLITLCLLTPAL